MQLKPLKVLDAIKAGQAPAEATLPDGTKITGTLATRGTDIAKRTVNTAGQGTIGALLVWLLTLVFHMGPVEAGVLVAGLATVVTPVWHLVKGQLMKPTPPAK
jgi:hypothetical protein